MKIYAITDRLDNQIYTILNKAGVTDKNNIYSINKFQDLNSKLEPNDKVIVISIGVLLNISNLTYILNTLMSKQVSFTSINENKLSFTHKNPLKPKYKMAIMSVLNNEQRVLNQCERSYNRKVNIQELITMVSFLTLVNLSSIFSNEGILQK